ncbi:MAG: nitrile hydratase subunit beta [Alphaproteobacteria bacterium]|nr:nitrile hydratase subunit beta [Alphaproteobacteria bacterium]MCB9927837.1 nitrile hydratase subunit beta [Alphaproteobacteria bacterium]
MNGAHDLGGMHGFGPIGADPHEPLFHAPWERRCFALTLAAGFTGQWNIDASRFAREQMAPAAYLSTGYYEHWLFGLEQLLVERGMASPAEIASGEAALEPKPEARVLKAADVATALAKGGPSSRQAAAEPRFRVGDRVRARNLNPATHTRLPRYARGKTGTVHLTHGAHVFPDTNALFAGEAPQPLYTVRFEGAELWGPDAEPGTCAHIDLWESYLEPA